MREREKKLQHAINDYLVESHAEYTLIYNNLDELYNLSFYLEKGLSEYFSSSNDNIDYSKITRISLFDKIELIKSFYKEMGIEFNFDRYLNDGTIDFVYYDFFNNNEDSEKEKFHHFGYGISSYKKSRRIVNICNNGFITDILVAVHELSHFRDQPDYDRNQVSDLLTESVAYAEELICMDYLSKLGYEEDMDIWEKHLFNSFYSLARNTRPIYKMFLVHKDLGNISKENYQYFFKSEDEYESIMKNMNRFIKDKNFHLYSDSSYVMAGVLGTYMYLRYKKDKSFINNISELHNRINDLSVPDCLKTIGLNDLGVEDKEILYGAIEEIKLELGEIGCQKIK